MSELNTYITYGDLETKMQSIKKYVEDDICNRLAPIQHAIDRNIEQHDELNRNYNQVMVKMTSVDAINVNVEEIKQELKEWKKIFVDRKEFGLVRSVVFGAVGFILFSVLTVTGGAVVYFLTV